MRTRALAIATLVAALGGLTFASVATYDFAAHLDRGSDHTIHCSFVPGLAATEGGAGCQVTLMSPYSSVLRTEFWGGIPISLPGMCVFAFLAFWSAHLLITGAHRERRSAAFTALAWVVPTLTSLVMAYIAFVELGAACKLCIGIYSSSLLGVIFASALYYVAGRDEPMPAVGATDATYASGPPRAVTPPRSVAWAVPLAVLFVLVPTGAYVAAMPDYTPYHAGCGQLAHPEDPHGVLVGLGGSATGRPAIEVLDPLCASCRAFEGRLAASGLDEQLKREALLFPLDDECNWMVGTAMHPGACAVSEAILCEPAQAQTILAWSFEHQERIMAAERANRGAAARLVSSQFPAVRGCVGSSRIRSKLTRGLRWAVANELPIMTPQLFVGGRKLCNDDTDLGLEYTISRMLEQAPGATP